MPLENSQQWTKTSVQLSTLKELNPVNKYLSEVETDTSLVEPWHNHIPHWLQPGRDPEAAGSAKTHQILTSRNHEIINLCYLKSQSLWVIQHYEINIVRNLICAIPFYIEDSSLGLPNKLPVMMVMFYFCVVWHGSQ